MEAEHNKSNLPLGAYVWMPVLNSGYSGTGALRIRALGYSYASDSLYVGLAVGGLTWTWSREKWDPATETGSVAMVTVPSIGVHTINVWMRESGIVLDKLVLTSNSSYVPTGTGPAESQ